jgi:hypothetical protein
VDVLTVAIVMEAGVMLEYAAAQIPMILLMVVAAVEAVVVAELELVPADSLLVEIADAKTQVGVLVMAVAPYKLLLPTLNERRVGEKFLGFSCARTLFYSIGI